MFGTSGNDGLQMSILQIFEFFILLISFLIEFQKFKWIQRFHAELFHQNSALMTKILSCLNKWQTFDFGQIFDFHGDFWSRGIWGVAIISGYIKCILTRNSKI